MGKQHNRRIFAGFYKRYDNKSIYVVAVVPDVDTGSQVVIFHEGIDACECKYYSMTKQSFCEMVEVDGEWVDKFVRQPQIRITDTHIQNLNDGGFENPVWKKKPKDEEELAYESRRFRYSETYTAYAKDLCTNYKIDLRRYNLCVAQKQYIGVSGKTDFDILKKDLAFLNDCKRTMVLHRASTMKKSDYNFKCYTYGKRGKGECTPHHIREEELYAIILDDLRLVTHFARKKERQFAEYINRISTAQSGINAVKADDQRHPPLPYLHTVRKCPYEH